MVLARSGSGSSAQMNSFQQAFESLLSVAPGPVFPRARELYLRKYPLEARLAVDGSPVKSAAASEAESEVGLDRFRTFLLEEEIQEAAGGIVRVRARARAEPGLLQARARGLQPLE